MTSVDRLRLYFPNDPYPLDSVTAIQRRILSSKMEINNLSISECLDKLNMSVEELNKQTNNLIELEHEYLLFR